MTKEGTEGPLGPPAEDLSGESSDKKTPDTRLQIVPDIDFPSSAAGVDPVEIYQQLFYTGDVNIEFDSDSPRADAIKDRIVEVKQAEPPVIPEDEAVLRKQMDALPLNSKAYLRLSKRLYALQQLRTPPEVQDE